LIYEWITVLFPSLVIKTGIIRKGIPLKWKKFKKTKKK
jgi:hypothetical protein